MTGTILQSNLESEKNMTDKILRQLEAMKISELRLMAGKFKPSLHLKKTWKGKRIAKAIRERQIEVEENLKSDQVIEVNTAPRNLDFEAAVVVPDLTDEKPVENRGGSREGSGRKPGMTAEKAAVKKLDDIKIPNAAIKAGIVGTYKGWAWLVKVPQLRLKDEEADFLALPVTKIQEYFWPGLVPEIFGVIGELIFAFGVVNMPRVELMNALHEAKREGKDLQPIIDKYEGKPEGKAVT